MNKLLENRIRRHIEAYKKKPTPILLETIFRCLNGYITGTLKTSLKMHRRFRTDEEVLSMAWDVFEDSMKTYVKGVGIRELFGSRAIIHVKRMVHKERRENRRTCSLEVIGEALLTDDTQQVIVGPVMDLRRFRETLTPEYRLVFDDALKSIGGNNRFKSKDARCPIPSGRYYESKNIFQMVISYFLTTN